MRVTFLESSHGIRLTKTISKTESKSYPDVKTVSSTEHLVNIDKDWPTAFASLLKIHADQGHCLLKGPLKKPAINESRAGLGDKIAYSDLLVLDVDNLSMPPGLFSVPMDSTDIQRLADKILEAIGNEFTQVSYVAQASSSLGRKQDRVSMHIYIPLSTPLPPKTIKLWLKHINQSVGLFRDQLGLSSTGQSIKYPLDPSVADNTKLIFIAPPEFTEAGLDPFVDPAERIATVPRKVHALDLATLVGDLSPEKIFTDSIELKDELREKFGLKKRVPKYTTVSIQGENHEVLTNPDKMSISIVGEALPYVRCNINGGDSGAYYFNITDPTYMYNFKDEPIFEIALADKDFHAAIFEKYKNNPDDPRGVRPLQPVVLRDFATDALYNGVYDPNSGKFSDAYPLTPTSSGAIEGFMRSHGQAVPGFVPEAKVVFDPPRGDQKPNLETIPYYVNLYRPSALQDAAVAPEEALTYKTAHRLKNFCPMIYKLIVHMCGDGAAETNHFLNWLSFIYQTRTKSMTAWVFGGVPGTGKGLFVNKILRPMFGEQHVTMKALENIEEQFNNFMRTAMFLVVDEFRMADAKGGAGGSTRIADKLKNQITEPTVTIRSMRSNQVELPSYTNFIFLTNRQDAVKIEAGDRRYNICPRQEVKLLEKYPDFTANLGALEQELPLFAGALETFKIDAQAARTCLANEAKALMQNVNLSVFDDFCNAFKNGDLKPIIDILGIEINDTFNAARISSAQKLVKFWMMDAACKKESVISPESMRIVFHVLNENQQPLAVRQFNKMLARNGIDAKPVRDGTVVVRGIKVEWKHTQTELDMLTDTYFKPEDHTLLKQRGKA